MTPTDVNWTPSATTQRPANPHHAHTSPPPGCQPLRRPSARRAGGVRDSRQDFALYNPRPGPVLRAPTNHPGGGCSGYTHFVFRVTTKSHNKDFRQTSPRFLALTGNSEISDHGWRPVTNNKALNQEPNCTSGKTYKRALLGVFILLPVISGGLLPASLFCLRRCSAFCPAFLLCFPRCLAWPGVQGKRK